MGATWRLIIFGVLTLVVRNMVPSNATDNKFRRSYIKIVGIEYVEIKVPAVCLNGNIYQ